MAVADLDPVLALVAGDEQASPSGRRWAVGGLAVGAGDADEAKAPSRSRVECLGVVGVVMAAPLQSAGPRRPRPRPRRRRPGPRPGARHCRRHSRASSAPPRGAQPPGPTHPLRGGLVAAGLTIPVAVTTAHGVVAQSWPTSRATWSTRSGGVGLGDAGGAGSSQCCWSMPGASLSEHMFRKNSRGHLVRLKPSVGWLATLGA